MNLRHSFLGELAFAPKGTCFVSFLPEEDTTSSLPSICLSFFMRTVWSSTLCIQYQLPCDNHISALALSILNGFLMSVIHKAYQNLTGCPRTFLNFKVVFQHLSKYFLGHWLLFPLIFNPVLVLHITEKAISF